MADPERGLRLAEWARRHRLQALLSPHSMRTLFGTPSLFDRLGCTYMQLGKNPGHRDFSSTPGSVECNVELGMAAMNTLARLLYQHKTGLPGKAAEVSIGGALLMTRKDHARFERDRLRAAPPRTPAAPVTQRQIARRLDVSLATVSLALRNDPRVSPRTRARVQEAAQRMRYRHNPLTDAWAGLFHDTHRHAGLVVAHVSGFPETAYAAEPRLQLLRAHIAERAAGREALLNPFHAGPGGVPLSRLRDILRARNITAVLWGPFPPDWPAPEFDWNGLVTVGIGDMPAVRPLNRVVFSRYLSMRTALLDLSNAGYKRPGLAGFGPAGEPGLRGWVPAYLQHADERPARHRVPWLPLEHPDRAAFEAWRKRHRPDVILSPFPALRDGLRDEAFLALDPDPGGPGADVAMALTPAADIAHEAIDQLIAHGDLHEDGLPRHPQATAFPATLRPGASCPGFG